MHYDTGEPVAGAFVEGTFSGNLEGGASGTTDANGVVTLITPGSKRGNVNVTFCVDDVTADLPYAPEDNSSPSYACSTEPPAATRD